MQIFKHQDIIGNCGVALFDAVDAGHLSVLERIDIMCKSLGAPNAEKCGETVWCIASKVHDALAGRNKRVH